MKLRAHWNVVSLAEWKRARERPARMEFVNLAERLTPEEIEALRRRAKERSAYLRKAFAHLRTKADGRNPK